jgi:hypothetical protein
MNTFNHNAFLKNKKRRDGEVCLNSVQNTFLAGGQAKRCADFLLRTYVVICPRSGHLCRALHFVVIFP